jgi:hypothetical protein
MDNDKNGSHDATAEHSVTVRGLNADVQIVSNCTIVEMLAAARLLERQAMQLLDGAQAAASIQLAESRGLVRQLGDLRRTS